jgi:hypothetical protein
MAGKNEHDDVPDALSQLVQFIESFTSAKVSIFQRPF